MEIAKVQLALEKTLFCKKMLAYHQDKKDPKSNEIMKLAFRSKKIKEPTFANEDPKNFEIWLESQKKYLNEELKIHESALAKFESDYQVSLNVETKKLDGSNEEGYKKSPETINQKTSQLKSNQSLRDKIQSEITSQLQQSIPLMIYNKRESKIEKIKEKTKLQLEDKNKYNPEDLSHNFLFDDLTRMFPDYEIKTEVKDKY